jgi:hypothetical protein
MKRPNKKLKLHVSSKDMMKLKGFSKTLIEKI